MYITSLHSSNITDKFQYLTVCLFSKKVLQELVFLQGYCKSINGNLSGSNNLSGLINFYNSIFDNFISCVLLYKFQY